MPVRGVVSQAARAKRRYPYRPSRSPFLCLYRRDVVLSPSSASHDPGTSYHFSSDPELACSHCGCQCCCDASCGLQICLRLPPQAPQAYSLPSLNSHLHAHHDSRAPARRAQHRRPRRRPATTRPILRQRRPARKYQPLRDAAGSTPRDESGEAAGGDQEEYSSSGRAGGGCC